MKSQSRQYSIRTNSGLVGMLEETTDTSVNWKNELLNGIGLHAISSKVFAVTTPEAKVFAYIKKSRGFNKDIDVFNVDNSNIATIHQKLNMKSQTLIAKTPDGSPFLRAEGKNGALDIVVKKVGGNESVISRIKRRSTPVPTVKESLLSGDHYHLSNSSEITEGQQLITIIMTMVMSEQLHLA